MRVNAAYFGALLAMYGLFSLPVSYLMSRSVVLVGYITGLLIMFLVLQRHKSAMSWIGFFFILLYILTFALYRPEDLEVAARLVLLSLVIWTSFFLAGDIRKNLTRKLSTIVAAVGVISAMIGIFQFLNGFSEFELSVLRGVGRIAKEYETLNMSRSIGIAFDPLSQGLITGIAFHCLTYNFRFQNDFLSKICIAVCCIVVVVSLLLTLNRTSMIAFGVSMMVYVRPNALGLVRKPKAIVAIIVLGPLLALSLTSLLQQPEFEYAYRAFSSLSQIGSSSDIEDEFFGSSQSLNKRVDSALSVLAVAAKSPFGVMENDIKFSVNDVGVLAPILKYGLLGGTLLLLAVFLPALFFLKFWFVGMSNKEDAARSELVFSNYLIVAVSNVGSFSLDGTIVMLPSWFIIALAYGFSMNTTRPFYGTQ